MPETSRVIIIVLDSLGVGELPDAADYGDAGSNTLGNMAQELGGLKLPNLEALGLGNIGEFAGIAKRRDSAGSYGKMAEKSFGKDTTTGHWEIAGLALKRPFPTYPDGFPPEVIEPFERAIGSPVIGNVSASGTEIIRELGEEHMRTGRPIVYTSADSVFQVAAHKDVIPLERLYEICQIARAQLTGAHAVGRVIARPFTGRPGSFTRTPERRDFSLPPPGPTLLDTASRAGLAVVGIGKIEDIFAGRGITRAVHTKDNADGMRATIEAMRTTPSGIIMVNLVEFDMLYGHRNDPAGYYGALREFDRWLPRAIELMGPSDALFITADHGCDPTTPSTDHSREYVPLLVFGPGLRAGVDLGTRASFCDLGATAAGMLGIISGSGESFLGLLTQEGGPPKNTLRVSSFRL